MKLEVRELSKSFGSVVAPEPFSAVFSDARPTCLMGPSGCGKTTLGNLLLGLMKPDTGQILDFPNRRNSAVFQEDRLLESLCAIDNVRLVCPRDRTPNTVDTIVRAFDTLGLSGEELTQPVRALSGGMRRRVALLRALLHPSTFLLLDEPFSGLDAVTRQRVLAVLPRYLHGRIVVLITHDASDASALDAVVLRMTHHG